MRANKFPDGKGFSMNKLAWSAVCAVLAFSSVPVAAQNAPAPATPAARQQAPNPFQSQPLGDGPWEVQTADAKLNVEVVTKGLDRPWGMAFLPDGAMLLTERTGQLRIVRDGGLDPTPSEGLPT